MANAIHFTHVSATTAHVSQLLPVRSTSSASPAFSSQSAARYTSGVGTASAAIVTNASARASRAGLAPVRSESRSRRARSQPRNAIRPSK